MCVCSSSGSSILLVVAVGGLFLLKSLPLYGQYCKFGYFRENFIFSNSDKRHICNVQNSRPGYYLHISVNDRVISPYRESCIFTKLRICEVSRK